MHESKIYAHKQSQTAAPTLRSVNCDSLNTCLPELELLSELLLELLPESDEEEEDPEPEDSESEEEVVSDKELSEELDS